MIVGGDYRKPDDTGATAAITADGGKTWTAHRQAASLSLGRGLGEGSLGRGRHVGLPCFPGQRRHLEAA